MADRTGCAFVGLAHFNKSASLDPLNLITGSQAFSAVARAVLAVARDDDSEDGSCVISQAKNNLGRLDLPSLGYRIESREIETDDGPAEVGRLVMVGETERNVRDILAESGGDPEARSERDEAASWLREYLTQQGGSAKAADILRAARADGTVSTGRQQSREARHAACMTREVGYSR